MKEGKADEELWIRVFVTSFFQMRGSSKLGLLFDVLSDSWRLA